MIRRLALYALGIFFIVAGLNHFLHPEPYLAMIPPYLPWHSTLNVLSGFAEIAGGLGVFFPPFRRAAGWGLIALLIVIFPANVQIALFGWPGVDLPRWILWARLPFQFLFIAWVYWTCLAASTQRKP